ncbi:DNA polymerase IV, partial [Halobacteriales archaeon QH_10_67_13]
GEVDSFLAPLDVEAVHGVGPVTAGRLRKIGIETGGDLAAADPARLGAVFGERGRRIVRFARGEDDRAVEPRGRPKSLSRESAFRTATTDPERQRARLRALAADVAERADREDALYATIGIKVITEPYEVATRAQSLSGPVADPALVRTVSRELFGEFAGDPVRKLGVRVSSLSFTQGDQETLGAYESTPDATAEDRVQRRLDRFGDGSGE